MSPTPATSTVKLRKKSTMSRARGGNAKMRIRGVTRGLSSSSRMKTCNGEQWGLGVSGAEVPNLEILEWDVQGGGIRAIGEYLGRATPG